MVTSQSVHHTLTAGAKHELEAERTMTLGQALRMYPKAIMWSMVISLPIIMTGYDLALIGNFYAFPQFNQKYGERLDDGTYALAAPWQSALTNGVLVGEMLGLLANGWACERWGYKFVTQMSLAILTCLIFIPFFAPTVQVLLVGQILCGIPWGALTTLTIAYAADVCPAAIRAYMTSYVTLCWIIGSLLATGVLRGLLDRKDEWAYRIPFALQWMWPLPIFCAVFFAPESPYWLIRHDRVEEARHAIRKLTSVPTEKVEDILALMTYTTQIEELSTQGTSYWDCFKGTNLRRTEIVCIYGGVVQTLCGQALAGLSVYFFTRAGLDPSHAFSLGLGQLGILLVGFFLGWICLNYVGRRQLALIGLSMLSVLLFIVGFLSLAPKTNTDASWAAGVMLVAWSFVAGVTFYPTVFPIQGEIPSTRLRGKTIVLQRNLYNIVGVVMSVLNLYMLNPTQWNMQKQIAFVYGSTCFCCVIYVYFRVPECKGLTYAELDSLFDRKVDARRFTTSAADPFFDQQYDAKTESI
ncbi:putative maltose permease [Aureobasidium namibiae CBS 147.97]|uniref:Putative maltose permease n=1 Tax=Aureobasidium namibiae CBS 147.97 TaxID=1043004 RepID=A0A074XKT9_9PEZI|nr:putative maltose permease [Aureobasidium namibiae CBS 147.97]KEQ75181.1 putative maltose permease [Aureobasidium namibiae CBS 147.97]